MIINWVFFVDLRLNSGNGPDGFGKPFRSHPSRVKEENQHVAFFLELFPDKTDLVGGQGRAVDKNIDRIIRTFRMFQVA